MRQERRLRASTWRTLVRSLLVAGAALFCLSALVTPAWAAVADLQPSSGLSFGSVRVGQTSSSQPATISNSGPEDINVNSISAGGDFAAIQGCLGLLIAGGNCVIDVTFSPSSRGAQNVSLTVTTDIGGSPSIALDGTGVSPGVSMTGVASFGNVRTGTTSVAHSTTLTNTGNMLLTINSISVTGTAFNPAGDTCGGSLGIGLSCTISATFSPTSTIVYNGSISVSSDADSSPDSVGLTGTGTAPAVTVSPSSLSFGNQGLNTTSLAKSITVTNTGTASLVISSISTTGDFHQTETCPGSLIAGAHCTVSITFRPGALGGRTGHTNVATEVGTRTVSLSGTGVAPSVSLSQATLNFGDIRLNKTSSPQTVTMKNIGTQTLNISGISAGNDFAKTDTCPSSLGVGQTCSISVTFHPTSLGVHNSQLVISGSSGTQTVGLTGRGVAPAVKLKPSSLNFGKQPVGLGSKPKTITLTNTGTAPLTVTGVLDFGNFAETDTCTKAPIAPGGTCVISVTFTPTDYAERKGAIAVDDDAGRQTVALAGIGVTAASAGFGAGSNTPPYSPIPQSGPPGQTNQPPQSAGGGLGGSKRTVIPIAVGGGALVLILLGWVGLLGIRRRRRERPPPPPMPGEVPLMSSVEERGVDGQLFVSEPIVSTEVLEPVAVGVASAPDAAEDGFSGWSQEAVADEAPPEPTPEEAPPEIPPTPAPPEEPAADRPLVPMMSSLEAIDTAPSEQPVMRTRPDVSLQDLFQDGQEHADAPPEPTPPPQPAPESLPKPVEDKQRGRRGRREATRETESTSPLLGLIEKEMTALDEQTDRFREPSDDESAS